MLFSHLLFAALAALPALAMNHKASARGQHLQTEKASDYGQIENSSGHNKHGKHGQTGKASEYGQIENSSGYNKHGKHGKHGQTGKASEYGQIENSSGHNKHGKHGQTGKASEYGQTENSSGHGKHDEHDEHEKVGYLLTHFYPDAGKEQVYFHLSKGNDPLSYEPLNDDKPVLVSNVGSKTVRDSFIAHNPLANKYWLIGNNQSLDGLSGAGSYYQGYNGIVVFDARDDTLTSWSKPRLLSVAGEGSLHVFAPEAIWLPSKQKFLLQWSGAYKDDPTQRIYACYTADFTSCSLPFIYYEEADRVGDMSIRKLSGSPHGYVRFWVSNGNDSKILGQYSENGVRGDWKDILPTEKAKISAKGIDPSAGGSGPIVFRDNLHPRTYYVWILEGSYEPFETNNIRILPYSYVGNHPGFPKNVQQGNVIAINRKQRNALKKKWGDSK